VSHCKEPCPDHLCLEVTRAGMCGFREPELQWEAVGRYGTRCIVCGFVALVRADATIEEHMRVCRLATDRRR
jgi:hypothetical protein